MKEIMEDNLTELLFPKSNQRKYKTKVLHQNQNTLTELLQNFIMILPKITQLSSQKLNLAFCLLLLESDSTLIRYLNPKTIPKMLELTNELFQDTPISVSEVVTNILENKGKNRTISSDTENEDERLEMITSRIYILLLHLFFSMEDELTNYLGYIKKKVSEIRLEKEGVISILWEICMILNQCLGIFSLFTSSTVNLPSVVELFISQSQISIVVEYIEKIEVMKYKETIKGASKILEADLQKDDSRMKGTLEGLFNLKQIKCLQSKLMGNIENMLSGLIVQLLEKVEDVRELKTINNSMSYILGLQNPSTLEFLLSNMSNIEITSNTKTENRNRNKNKELVEFVIYLRSLIVSQLEKVIQHKLNNTVEEYILYHPKQKINQKERAEESNSITNLTTKSVKEQLYDSTKYHYQKRSMYLKMFSKFYQFGGHIQQMLSQFEDVLKSTASVFEGINISPYVQQNDAEDEKMELKLKIVMSVCFKRMMNRIVEEIEAGKVSNELLGMIDVLHSKLRVFLNEQNIESEELETNVVKMEEVLKRKYYELLLDNIHQLFPDDLGITNADSEFSKFAITFKSMMMWMCIGERENEIMNFGKLLLLKYTYENVQKYRTGLSLNQIKFLEDVLGFTNVEINLLSCESESVPTVMINGDLIYNSGAVQKMRDDIGLEIMKILETASKEKEKKIKYDLNQKQKYEDFPRLNQLDLEMQEKKGEDEKRKEVGQICNIAGEAYKITPYKNKGMLKHCLFNIHNVDEHPNIKQIRRTHLFSQIQLHLILPNTKPFNQQNFEPSSKPKPKQPNQQNSDTNLKKDEEEKKSKPNLEKNVSQSPIMASQEIQSNVSKGLSFVSSMIGGVKDKWGGKEKESQQSNPVNPSVPIPVSNKQQTRKNKAMQNISNFLSSLNQL